MSVKYCYITAKIIFLSIIISIFIIPASATVLASDDFNRANNTDLGADWYETYYENEILNNMLHMTDNSNLGVIYNYNISNYPINISFKFISTSSAVDQRNNIFINTSTNQTVDGVYLRFSYNGTYTQLYFSGSYHVPNTTDGGVGQKMINDSDILVMCLETNKVKAYIGDEYVGFWDVTLVPGYCAIITGTANFQWSIDDFVIESVSAAAPEFDMVITYFNRTNQTNMVFETSNYTAGITQIDIEYPFTDNGNIYSLHHYTNDTQIGSSQTATATNQSLWFNNTVLDLPESICYFKETEGTSTMTIPVNSWGMFNNWTSTMTFAGIDANESNDICYAYYNVTSGLWKSYYVGYAWNADYQLSKDTSVIGYFNAPTDITSNIITPSSTELYTGWNMLGVQSSSNQTISGIIADIGVNCSDSWYFNSSTGGYSNTTTHSIQPNQGFLAYITQNMTWTRSTM